MDADVAEVLAGTRQWAVVEGDALALLPTLPDGCVGAVVTDPPFGARRPSARRSAGERFREVVGNEAVDGRFLPDAHRLTAEGGALYCFACWDRYGRWSSEVAAAGFRVRSCIVWDKEVHGLADLETCWAPRHELILFAAKGRHVLRGKRPVDIIRCLRLDAAALAHPYQKPVPVVVSLLRASTDPGDVVLDPFMGSGTTGVACLMTGRRFIGVEIDPGYAALARRRLAEASNQTGLFAGLAQPTLFPGEGGPP